MEMLVEVVEHSLMITCFVFVMMLIVEYLNVLTEGRWERKIQQRKWGQLFLAALFGAVPGCLGAYAVCTFYMHRVITFGALTAAMIATCGDEGFIMLALFPQKALLIMVILFFTGAFSGIIVDLVLKERRTRKNKHLEEYKAIHVEEERCTCFSRHKLWEQWKHCSAHRGWLVLFLLLFVLAIVSGKLGHHDLDVMTDAVGHSDWNWVRITMLVIGMVGLFIVSTVPDHFLEEHLWKHIARTHIWRVFLWTFGALLVMHVLLDHLDLEPLIRDNRLMVLMIACLVGLIPQSGPHLIFVTLYAQGAIPFSTLLASCVVQDGHGMLPMLAHSRRAFLAVKLVNLAIGLALGLAGILLGF